MNNTNQELFAFVVDGEVFHIMSAPKDIPETQRLIAGLKSNPMIVNASDKPEILQYPDWKYDYETKNFYREDHSLQHLNVEPDYEVED